MQDANILLPSKKLLYVYTLPQVSSLFLYILQDLEKAGGFLDNLDILFHLDNLLCDLGLFGYINHLSDVFCKLLCGVHIF